VQKKRRKQKKPQLASSAFVAATASVLSAAPLRVKGERGQQCTTEFTTSGFAAQPKEERKIKGWDEKEAVGNELLGNAFGGE